MSERLVLVFSFVCPVFQHDANVFATHEKKKRMVFLLVKEEQRVVSCI